MAPIVETQDVKWAEVVDMLSDGMKGCPSIKNGPGKSDLVLLHYHGPKLKDPYARFTIQLKVKKDGNPCVRQMQIALDVFGVDRLGVNEHFSREDSEFFIIRGHLEEEGKLFIVECHYNTRSRGGNVSRVTEVPPPEPDQPVVMLPLPFKG